MMKPIDSLFDGLGNNTVSDQMDSHNSAGKGKHPKDANYNVINL